MDPSAVFVSTKSHEGRPLKALERPGLWNGAMAGWNTVFVEVPDETFAPVKTVLDLLRPEHQEQTSGIAAICVRISSCWTGLNATPSSATRTG